MIHVRRGRRLEPVLPCRSLLELLECPHHICAVVGFRVIDRKSTRLNSSHRCISYAVFCLTKTMTRREKTDYYTEWVGMCQAGMKSTMPTIPWRRLRCAKSRITTPSDCSCAMFFFN